MKINLISLPCYLFYLLGISLALSGPSLHAQPDSASNVKLEPFEFSAQNGETVAAERGVFWVPENRNNRNSRTLKLSFVRFASTNPNPGAPIVYLAGGPGGSGIDAAQRWRFPLFMALREVADVIALDQRGTGASNDIPVCNSSVAFAADRPLTYPEHITKMRQAAVECATYWKTQQIDLAGYTSWESAADLDDLRRALGAKKISLWGISYGSHLALAALKRYPDSIERVVLASIEGPDESVKLPARTDAYFARLQATIDLHPASKAKYPDLAAMMRRVHQKLEDEPVSVTFTDAAGGKQRLVFAAYDLQRFSSGMIADPQRWANTLPALYSLLDTQGAQALPNDFLAVLHRTLRAQPGISMRGMPEAMDAASGISKKRQMLIDAQAEDALLGHALNFPYYLLQQELGVPDQGDDFRAFTRSDVPTLFLSGTLDGRTYVESAAENLEKFTTGKQVIIENAGHNLFMSSPEIGEMILAFFSGKPVTKDRISLPPPKFE